MTANQGATTIDRLIAIGLALLAASAAAAEPNPTDNPSSFTPQRDAAVVYVKERSFYISRMAQRCRKILDMPESPDSQPEATAWNAANRRYSTAVAIYESKQQPRSHTGLPVIPRPGQGTLEKRVREGRSRTGFERRQDAAMQSVLCGQPSREARHHAAG